MDTQANSEDPYQMQSQVGIELFTSVIIVFSQPKLKSISVFKPNHFL